MKSQIISVAGFKIKVQSECEADIAFEEGYTPFFISENSINIDVTVNAIEGIPSELFTKDDILFEVKNMKQHFFSIYKHYNSYKLIIYDQLNIGVIQQIAILNNELTEWKVYCEKVDNRIYPLQYPFGPLVLYYLTVKYDAIMIHSSGVFDNDKGRIFSGFSGAGKSTMAGIWQSKGNSIINDDRLIIRKNNEGYIMHNTPMFYVDTPKEAPVHSIHLIHHSPKNTLKKIKGAMAVSRVMAHCIQHVYNYNFILHHLDFLSQLSKSISVYDIGFKPDLEIIDFIKKNAD